MFVKIDIFSIFVSFFLIDTIYAKRILVISNVPSYSHQITYRALCLELQNRGHEMVVVTTDPIKNSSLANYTEISLNHFYYDFYSELKKCGYTGLTEASMELPFTGVERFLWCAYHIFNRETFNYPEMKKLYAADSNEHFDAVIVATIGNPSLNAFAYRFNAPLIGISSQDTFNHLRYTFGSYILPSHISNWQVNRLIENDMPFWKRIINFYEAWMQIYHWVNVRVPMENALVKKYLGEHYPHVDDITKNMSIFFLNKHPLMSFVRPEHPNIIVYNGFHIAKVPPALSEELKQTLDNATNGFIYVSLGSNVKWEALPNYILESFLKAFSALPYKIIWKYSKPLPTKHDNIMVSKWLPQQGILAHPNIKAFISQGGLQSSEEAIYYGVPLIGLPIFWDQSYRVKKLVELGVCISLQQDDISKEKIEKALHEIVNDKSYKNRMEDVSKLYKDVPYDSLQNVAWWVEHVMRHNGILNYRYSACDQPWYRRYDWDVIGFIIVGIFLTLVMCLYTLFYISCFIYRYYTISYNFSRNDLSKTKTQ